MQNTDPWACRCPECDTDGIFFISLLVGGSPYRFSCCHACETKWWEREGRTVPLHSVLTLVAGP